MPLPTLSRKGNLRDPLGRSDVQAKFDELVPIDYIVEWFRSRQSASGIANRVLILKAETASGKSTYLLSSMYRALVRGGDRSIVCTQPRILTAIRNVFEILKHNRDVLRLGDTIGYSAGGQRVPTRSSGILSVTVGTLALELKMNPDAAIIDKYRYIMIDETHERSPEIDMTLYMLKNFLRRNADNPRCPFVVCMSATFEPGQFVTYFVGDNPDAIANNHIWVTGANQPITNHFGWNGERVVNNAAQAAAEVVKRIVESAPDDDPARADVLIFMPGAGEITETAMWLDRLNRDLATRKLPVFSVLKIDRIAVTSRNTDYQRLDIPVRAQSVRVGDRTLVPSRRVVISTNVAETGLTLENLKYVVDAGFNRETEYNPNFGIRALITKPAPWSRITQRRGRVGRNFPGEFYPLYPQYVYDRLPHQQLPQILLDDPSPIMIDIMQEQLRGGAGAGVGAGANSGAAANSAVRALAPTGFRIADIDMLDPPSSDALADSLDKLYQLGLVSVYKCPQAEVSATTASAPAPAPAPAPTCASDIRPTEIGLITARLTRLSPESARMVLAAFAHRASVVDAITIAAYVGSPSDRFAVRGEDGMKIAVDWAAIYAVALAKTKMRITYAQTRLAVCDEFIDGIILTCALREQVLTAPLDIGKWCQRVNLNYDGVLVMLRERDEIIDAALRAGLDVFANEARSLEQTLTASARMREFMDVVTALKYCIYDGYRRNTLHLRDGRYVMVGGLSVRAAVIFGGGGPASAHGKFKYSVATLPQVLLYNAVSLKQNMRDRTGTYVVVADKISQMDGYVNIDDHFVG